MTVVYIDQLVVINLMADYLLLLCTARICAIYASRLRLAACALLGAAYPAAILIFHLQILGLTTVRLAVGCAMCAGAFGIRRRTLRAAAVFYLVSFLFAGFFVCLRGLMAGVRGRLSAAALLLCLMLAAVFILRVLSRTARQSAGGVRRVSVILGGKKAAFNALVDTGNSLQDPVSGKNVLIAELESVSPLFPPGTGRALHAQKSAAAQLSIAAAAMPQAGFRLVPFRTVGSGDLLPAFRPDCLMIDGKKMPGVLVALSTARISDGGAYTALAGDWN